MIGCLRTHVPKQPIIAIYFEFENELKFYNLGNREHSDTPAIRKVSKEHSPLSQIKDGSRLYLDKTKVKYRHSYTFKNDLSVISTNFSYSCNTKVTCRKSKNQQERHLIFIKNCINIYLNH